MFFFAKKNQKTFARLAAEAQAKPSQAGKSFWLILGFGVLV
jgi:hypothetical protein